MIEPAKLVSLGFLKKDNIGCIERAELLKGKTTADLERVEFWDEPGQELVAFSSIEEFVESEDSGIDFLSSIIVHGYARMKISLEPGCTLESVLECLDENYGDPDGSDNTEPTEKMLKAEAKLHAAIIEGYRSWMCEPVVEVVVDLTKWGRDGA